MVYKPSAQTEWSRGVQTIMCTTHGFRAKFRLRARIPLADARVFFDPSLTLSTREDERDESGDIQWMADLGVILSMAVMK